MNATIKSNEATQFDSQEAAIKANLIAIEAANKSTCHAVCWDYAYNEKWESFLIVGIRDDETNIVNWM